MPLGLSPVAWCVAIPGADPSWCNRELRIEIFEPPYFFKPRPQIAANPETVLTRQLFFVDTPQAGSIAQVVLLKIDSATHGHGFEQRYVGLEFDRIGNNRLLVRGPYATNVAPPGYYLLFVVDGNRVPSVGKFVRVLQHNDATHAGAMVHGNWGTNGDFEMVVPDPTPTRLVHCFRANDAIPPAWHTIAAFGHVASGGQLGTATYLGATLIQSNFGVPNLGKLHAAAVLRRVIAPFETVTTQILHYAMDDATGVWALSERVDRNGEAEAQGSAAIIQGRFGNRGNFELVVPTAGGGIARYSRFNDQVAPAWELQESFASGVGVNAVSLVQSNYDRGDLWVVARIGNRLGLFRGRVPNPPGGGETIIWEGPEYFFEGATGMPGFIQSRYGLRGDFEVVTPTEGGGLAHMSRRNDESSPVWVERFRFGAGATFSQASLFQSHAGDPGLGNLEVAARMVSSTRTFFYREIRGSWSLSDSADVCSVAE